MTASKKKHQSQPRSRDQYRNRLGAAPTPSTSKGSFGFAAVNTACWLIIVLAITRPGVAHGQSRAELLSDPGADMTVVVDINVSTSLFGSGHGSSQDTAPVTGTGLVTLFPTTPPFTHCTFHALWFEIGQIDLSYPNLVLFFDVDAMFSNLTIESTAPFNGTIDEFGNLFVPVAPMTISGSARIAGPDLGIDEVIDIDTSSSESITGSLRSEGGVVIMSGLVLPPVDVSIPPELLPSGITALEVRVVTNASDIVLRGPFDTARLGDSDADDDLDTSDWTSLVNCLGGVDEASGVFCSMFQFDLDEDVDLRDAADFALDFTGP